jgi:glycosyltransferase involved in cell wall biosynthesis
MRILEINTEKTWRGGERQTWLTIKGLKEAGVDVELLCLADHPLAERASALKVTVHKVRSFGGALGFLAGSGKNYDLLHAQTAKGQTLAVLTKSFHKRPVLYTRRVDFVPKGTLTRLKYRLTDKVVAISRPIAEMLEDLGFGNIDVIASAVEQKTLNYNRSEQFKKDLRVGNRKIIATTAALVPHKDPLTMVKAVRELLKTRDDIVFLHFGDGNLRGKVEAMIGEHGVDEFYKLLGHHDGVEDFFGILDVFVMSSELEGLGSSVLDAFIYKVPVVSTDAGGLKDCVGERGILCPVKDYRCLAESINRVMDDDGLRKGLVKKAYEYVTEFHSVEMMVSKYMDIYGSML